MTKARRVTVNDSMQRGYSYLLTEPAGRNFAPDFRPDLTPREMLELGVFGGKYMTDCRAEFPATWFTRAKLCRDRHDPALNFFGVNASQPLSVWRRKGWIHPDDPRGWFQWYCRYYLGRRGPDDERHPSLARRTTSRRAAPERVRSRRLGVSATTAPGPVALGVRFATDVG